MMIPLYPTLVHTHRYTGGENKRKSTKYFYLSARISLLKKKNGTKRKVTACVCICSPLFFYSPKCSKYTSPDQKSWNGLGWNAP